MADEKSQIVTDATGPDAGPAPVQPEAGGGTLAPKQKQPAPEAVSLDKATAPEQATPAQPEKGDDAPKEQKAASVSVFNFSRWTITSFALRRETLTGRPDPLSRPSSKKRPAGRSCRRNLIRPNTTSPMSTDKEEP